MALLTNINGKFSVSDAGAVTFNNAFTFPTTDGTANYVLKTNGSGTVSWSPDANTGTVTGTGAANRVTYWDSTTNVTSDAGFTYNGFGRVTTDESFNVSKNGADTVADGPFFGLKNAAETRQYINQLDASNNIDYWYYNGTTWTQTISLLNNGGATFAGNVTVNGTLTIGGNSAITRSGSIAQGRLAIWQNDTAIKGNNNLFYASQYLTVGVGTEGGFAAIRINAATTGDTYLDFTDGASFTKRAQIQVDTNDNMYFRNTSSNSLRMTLLSGGNFGIGEPVPLKPLHVKAPDAAGNIRLTRAGTSEYKDIGTYYTYTNGNSAGFGTTSAHKTFLTTNTYNALEINSSQEVSLLGFVGGDGFTLPHDENTGYSNFAAGGFGILFREAADNYIVGNAYYYKTGGASAWKAKYASGATLIASNVGEITFQTATSVAAGATLSFDPKMVIKNDGKVGIGLTGPSEKLHVAGNVFLNANSAFKASYNNTDSYHGSMRWSGLQLGNNGANNIVAGRTNTGGGFKFWTNNTNDAANYTVTPDGIMTMAMTNTGNVGIGVDSPEEKLHVVNAANASVDNFMLELQNTTTVADSRSGILFSTNSGTGANRAGCAIQGSNNGINGTGHLLFGSVVSNTFTERMRITSAGYLKVGSTTTIGYHEFVQSNTNGEWSTVIRAKTVLPYGLLVNYTTSPNNNSNNPFHFSDATATRFFMYSNGAIYNNGTYGTISDRKLKENIKDATPKLDDINKLKVRNFNFKDKPEEKHIGFIAQELEEVFPKAVENSQDRDSAGKIIKDSYTKTIKTSILIPMLVKSIQELKAEIEILKNK